MCICSLERGLPVFLMSGQGSQKPGMGLDVMDIPEIAETLECASDVLGKDMRSLCLESDAETLNRTDNAQAAIAALSIGIARALMARGIRPAAVAGFSLGQISALPVAGMLSVEDTFKLVDVRAKAMARAAESRKGAMAAFLSAERELVAKVCEEASREQIVVPANFNCPGQIVVSGDEEAVLRAMQAWQDLGKKAIRLATSGGFHSPLMEGAASELRESLLGLDFAQPAIPIICNTDACAFEPEEAVERLCRQLSAPVLFEETVVNLSEAGAQDFIECGFGGVLEGLVKRTNRKLGRACVQDKASLEACLAARVGS